MTLVPNFTYNPHVERNQKQLGFTGKDLDGKRGNMTMEAVIEAMDEGRVEILPPLVVIAPPEVTKTTLITDHSKLKGVHPDLVGLVNELSQHSKTKFSVIEGLRTKERQAALVRAGASKTSNSRHLTGHAVDLWPQDANGKNLPSDAAFTRGSPAARAASEALWAGLREISVLAKQIAKERGVLLEWGGDWGWDAPHFQLNRKAYPA